MAAPASAVAADALESGVLDGTQASRLGALTEAFGRLKENVYSTFREAKPWSELVDRSTFSRPTSSSEAISRVRWNTAYFRVNYLLVGLTTTALVMALHPWSLVVLAGLAALWFYLLVIRTTPLSYNGREISDREKVLGLAGLSVVVIFLLTSVGSTLIYALGLSATLVAIHAAFKVPDDLFLDAPPEAAPGGLLAVFTGAARAASAVSAAQAPPVAAAV